MRSTKEPARASLTVQVVNPLIEAVTHSFTSMLSAGVQRTGLELRKPDAPLYEYSALIGLSGACSGSFCLSFSKPTAEGAVAAFTGLPLPLQQSFVLDGVAEFANIISGNTKDRLELPLNLGVPNVVNGSDYSVTFPAESKPMRVTFDSDLGPFLVDFGFTQSKAY